MYLPQEVIKFYMKNWHCWIKNKKKTIQKTRNCKELIESFTNISSFQILQITLQNCLCTTLK